MIDRTINVNAMARKVEVDNRIPLSNYYRIADNLLKQASIYRNEKNLIDLYVILLRFSSLVSETIPFHRDYQALLLKKRAFYKKKLLDVIEELESLKPDFQRQVDELNGSHKDIQIDGPERTSYTSKLPGSEWSSVNNRVSSNIDLKWMHPANQSVSQPSSKHFSEQNQVLLSNPAQIDKQFQKLSLSLPRPKEETLSRHSLLGPSGLQGQWLGPSTGIKVHYPSNANLIPSEENLCGDSLNQVGQNGLVAVKDSDLGRDTSAMEAVLSLDDGGWSHPAENPFASSIDLREDLFQLSNARQPSPPPVLARVENNFLPISPSKVADPRPGPAKSSTDGMASSNTYQHLHIPIKMMEDFLRLAQINTAKNLETCGVLAGSLKNRIFHITTLIVPKQESTSDSCQTLNEEEIFEVQDKLSLFPLGWIHTHPSQTCFMSSVDLHTHYSYQIMLPEAVAIVMAPTDTSSPHGIFHLSDPGGVSVIRNCQERGFHPHEEPPDGSPIYQHCSHVYMNANLKFSVVDLR